MAPGNPGLLKAVFDVAMAGDGYRGLKCLGI
jgi:hypothetical protein